MATRKSRSVVPAHSERVPTGFWVCDAEGYERIITAVGERYAMNVDRDRLVFDLLTAREKLLAAVALDSDSGAHARKKLFSEIVDSAIDFKKKLLDDRGHKYAAREIASRFPPSHFEAFLAALDHAIKAAKAFEEENSHGGWMRLERPLKEWFAAEILPTVFKSNFERHAKVSRPGMPKAGANTADGPYLRFAIAVMREMGMSISPETVARALKDVRMGRKRRKPRPATPSGPPG